MHGCGGLCRVAAAFSGCLQRTAGGLLFGRPVQQGIVMQVLGDRQGASATALSKQLHRVLRVGPRIQGGAESDDECQKAPQRLLNGTIQVNGSC